jgi:hypothetical protein
MASPIPRLGQIVSLPNPRFLDVESFQRRRRADLVVLWISGGNHHP